MYWSKRFFTRPDAGRYVARGWAFAGLMLLVGAPANAALLSMTQALDAAFANNPDLAAARWESAISSGERQQAGAIPNPEISWEAEDTRSDSRTTTVMLSQALELGGKRGARIEVANKAQSAADVEFERRRNALRAEVIQAFYGASLAQQKLLLSQQSLALAENGLKIAQGRVDAGRASPIETTRAQVQLSEVRLELQRAQRDKAGAYQQLAQLTGAPDVAFSGIEDRGNWLPAAPAYTQLAGRLNDTPELRLALIQIDQRQASLGLEKARRIPDLTLSVGSQYDAGERERVNVIGVSMPIPLFDRNQGNVLAAARRADQALDLRNATELRLRTEIQLTLNQWSTSSEEVKSLDKVILPAAQDAVATATKGFEMGKFNFLDVLDAQRTLIAARTQYTQAMAESIDAWVRVERIFGDVSGLAATP